MYAWMESAGPAQDIHAAEPWANAPPPAWQFADNVLRYLVARDASFDSNNDFPMGFDDVVSEQAIRALYGRTNAGSGDDPQALSRFLAQGRKLILYHGLSDGWITPYRTEQFYEDWARRRGGYGRLQNSARLFMVPGMYHCGGGPGPNRFDTLSALESWVEQGTAPEGILATKYTNDDPTQPVLRTMPLCQFPEQAQYKGSGDVNDAANWQCTPNRQMLRVGLDGFIGGLQPGGDVRGRGFGQPDFGQRGFDHADDRGRGEE